MLAVIDHTHMTLAYIYLVAPWFYLLLFVIFGAVFGSFLTCCVYRVPRGISLSNPKTSYCPSCDHKLGVLDLVPVLSYLLSLGKCRYCKSKVHPRYLAIELLAIACGVFSWVCYGFKIEAILSFFAGLTLLFVASVYVLEKKWILKVLPFSIILICVIIFDWL